MTKKNKITPTKPNDNIILNDNLREAQEPCHRSQEEITKTPKIVDEVQPPKRTK